jgi:lysozyme
MGKKKKDRRSLWMGLSLVLMFFVLLGFYYLYPRFVRYPGFGIPIPSGYSIHGIDVSHYQGRINWNEVAKMNIRGITVQFCIIKASQGLTLSDSRFAENWNKAKKAGIVRGAYHYFEPGVDGRLQAKRFLAIVNPEKGDLVPVVDIETTNGLSRDALIQSLSECLQAVELQCGNKPIIYTGADFYTKYLEEAFDEYPLWVAHYFAPFGPRVGRKWQIWQHSEKGRVNGISKAVDFNVFNGNQAEFGKLLLN